MKGYCMYIVKYSELVHMSEMYSQARASSPYELVPNILRYTFNNLYLLSNNYMEGPGNNAAHPNMKFHRTQSTVF